MTKRSMAAISKGRSETEENAIGEDETVESTMPLWLLLVEDDPGDQMLVQEIAKATDLNVKLTLVKDGGEAVRCIERWSESNRPDLVLLDLNLPKKDALGVFEQMRRKDPTVRVAALTGFGVQSDITKEWEGRVDAYLVKPIGLDELDQTVERLKKLMQSIRPRKEF